MDKCDMVWVGKPSFSSCLKGCLETGLKVGGINPVYAY